MSKSYEELVRHLGVEIVPFDGDHFHAAVDAFLQYGGRRHAAGLNFGDCLSYAIASVAELPLLFTGQDFTRTEWAMDHDCGWNGMSTRPGLAGSGLSKSRLTTIGSWPLRTTTASHGSSRFALIS